MTYDRACGLFHYNNTYDTSSPQKNIQLNLENWNSDCSKYSIIRNKFGTQWFQRIEPIFELF